MVEERRTDAQLHVLDGFGQQWEDRADQHDEGEASEEQIVYYEGGISRERGAQVTIVDQQVHAQANQQHRDHEHDGKEDQEGGADRALGERMH